MFSPRLGLMDFHVKSPILVTLVCIEVYTADVWRDLGPAQLGMGG